MKAKARRKRREVKKDGARPPGEKLRAGATDVGGADEAVGLAQAPWSRARRVREGRCALGAALSLWLKERVSPEQEALG